MGSFQSKTSGPQIHSPRHSSIGGRLHIDSPGINSNRSLRSRNSFASPGSNRASSTGRLPVGETTPLVAKAENVVAVQHGSPPLMVWIGPALVCALAYALYNIFIKKGSASINPILGGVILQFVAAILGCVLLGGVILYNTQLAQGGAEGDDEEDFLEWDWTGVKWAILAGFAVGAAEMISFCVSGMGVQAMQSIPIIIGGSVMFGTVLGHLALGETLTPRGWSGVLLIAIGISFVGMDDEGEGV
ncbi:EamA-like transporter family [Seminavis robusta]|uniref:EamA-like transporter family n=1 Tax=Seminavis robusta TaxID=568900 RepID=A0A9N8H7R3_9STRA|nr:EamA-like transporter family [Seminavis robusta]|eukprot:Sro137_g064290.1 EamA-like transporter family (245) ;mRNA; f:22655-23389